jgi:hypothetical protein
MTKTASHDTTIFMPVYGHKITSHGQPVAKNTVKCEKRRTKKNPTKNKTLDRLTIK